MQPLPEGVDVRHTRSWASEGEGERVRLRGCPTQTAGPSFGRAPTGEGHQPRTFASVHPPVSSPDMPCMPNARPVWTRRRVAGSSGAGRAPRRLADQSIFGGMS